LFLPALVLLLLLYICKRCRYTVQLACDFFKLAADLFQLAMQLAAELLD
jgi:hypothetical protein